MKTYKVHKFLIALIALLVFGSQISADQFLIRDSEGFGRNMVAKAMTVPENWQSKGRIAWNKPCSSHDLYETIFLTQSSDGKAGARIMPGYQFMKDTATYTPGYAQDPMLDMMVAQSEGLNREMASSFRGSNCAVGILPGTDAILKSLILKNRPADARVLGARTDQNNLKYLRQTFGQGLPGVTITFDAKIIDLQYNQNGISTTERLFLTWYTFAQEPIDMGGVTVSSVHTIVEPLQLVWAPSVQAKALLPKLETIFTTIKTNPEWRRKVDEVERSLQNQRDKDRVARNDENDRRHREFIEMITGGEASPSAGSTGTGSSGNETGSQNDSDTDFWGDPKQETDFFGEPIKQD